MVFVRFFSGGCGDVEREMVSLEWRGRRMLCVLGEFFVLFSFCSKEWVYMMGIREQCVEFFFCLRFFVFSVLPFVGWCGDMMMLLLLVRCVVNEGIVLLRHQLSV